VPNPTVQLMVDPLLMRSIFFFSRRVRENVLRNFFSTEDVLRQQVEAKIKERSLVQMLSFMTIT
jgi:hypothetical protein